MLHRLNSLDVKDRIEIQGVWEGQMYLKGKRSVFTRRQGTKRRNCFNSQLELKETSPAQYKQNAIYKTRMDKWKEIIWSAVLGFHIVTKMVTRATTKKLKSSYHWRQSGKPLCTLTAMMSDSTLMNWLFLMTDSQKQTHAELVARIRLSHQSLQFTPLTEHEFFFC